MTDAKEAAERIVAGWQRSLSRSGYWEESDPHRVATAYLALLKAQGGGGWRTIESAPRDGTRIAVARHMDGFGWVLGSSYWEDVSGIAGWISRGWGIYGELGLGHPTHWRPLPSPPGESGHDLPSEEEVKPLVRSLNYIADNTKGVLLRGEQDDLRKAASLLERLRRKA